MAVDYAKKKNDELIQLLKDRSLPHTGKKADFVKRLEEYDASHPSASTEPSKPAAALEDEIDWDDEPAADIAKTATTEPAAEALAAGGVGEVKNPVAVPNQTLVEDPAKDDDLTVAAPEGTETAALANGEEKVEVKEVEAEPVKEKTPGKDFTSGIAERSLDEEIEKRKARARKFGLPEDSDEIKTLERAKKFGIQEGSKVLGLLNAGLSQNRKRGHENVEGGCDGRSG